MGWKEKLHLFNVPPFNLENDTRNTKTHKTFVGEKALFSLFLDLDCFRGGTCTKIKYKKMCHVCHDSPPKLNRYDLQTRMIVFCYCLIKS